MTASPDARGLHTAIKTRMEVAEAFIVRTVAGLMYIEQRKNQPGSLVVATNATGRLNVFCCCFRSGFGPVEPWRLTRRSSALSACRLWSLSPDSRSRFHTVLPPFHAGRKLGGVRPARSGLAGPIVSPCSAARRFAVRMPHKTLGCRLGLHGRKMHRSVRPKARPRTCRWSPR